MAISPMKYLKGSNMKPYITETGPMYAPVKIGLKLNPFQKILFKVSKKYRDKVLKEFASKFDYEFCIDERHKRRNMPLLRP